MKAVDTIQVIYNDSDDMNQSHDTIDDNIHSSLLSLLSTTSKPKNTSNIKKKKENYYFGEYEERENTKKRKRKKKKSIVDDLEIDLPEIRNSIKKSKKNDSGDEDNDSTTKSSISKIDVDDIFNDVDDDADDTDDIISAQKRSYKKNKKGTNNFKKEFAEELALLYSLLDETKSFGCDLEKMYKMMVAGKGSRAISKYTTDLIAQILSTKQTKLQVLKEIANIKKVVSDLSIKSGKGEDNNKDKSAMLAATYFNNIVKGGRNNFVKNLEDSSYNESFDNEDLEEFNKATNTYAESDEEREELTNQLMDDIGDKSYRTDEAQSYINNELRDVKIYIENNYETGEWSFLALDKNDTPVINYPLPSKDDVKPIKFSTDSEFATDRYGRTYKVINVC